MPSRPIDEEDAVVIGDVDPAGQGPLDVALHLLDWHEQVQPLRLAAVMESVLEVGVRVPVQVTRRGDRFMILDGAHRARAAQALGHRTLPCRLVDIADEAPIDGWTHRVPSRVPLELDGVGEEGKGRVVARVRDAHGLRELHAPLASDGSYFQALHTLSAQYRGRPYERVEAPVPDEADATQVAWVLPAWGIICDLVEDYGLLPAGVTRLSRYLP